MKISEIFKSNVKVAEQINQPTTALDAAPAYKAGEDKAFPTAERRPYLKFPIDPIEVEDQNSCECHKLYGNSIPEETLNQMRVQPAFSKERRMPIHKYYVGKILQSLQSNPEEVEALTGSDGDTETRQVNLLGHLFSHLYAAGMKPADIGVDDAQYENFKTRQYAMKNKQRAVAESACGTCEQHAKQFKNAVSDYKQRLVDEKLKSGPFSQEHADESANYITERAIKEWRQGTPSSDPHLNRVYETLGEMDKHTHAAHGFTMANYDHSHIPIDSREPNVADENNEQERNPNVDKVFNNLLNVNGRWDLVRRTDVPEKDPFWNEDGSPVVPRLENESQEQHEARWDEHIEKLLAGKLPGFEDWPKNNIRTNIPSSVPDTVRRNFPNPNVDVQAVDRPTRKKEDGTIEKVPLGGLESDYDFPNSQLREKTTVHLPSRTVEGYMPKDAVEDFVGAPLANSERILSDNILAYNPEKDKRPRKIRTPAEIKGHPEITANAFKSGLHSQIPRRDKFLFQQAGMLPDLRMFEEHQKATSAYEAQPTHVPVFTGEYEGERAEPGSPFEPSDDYKAHQSRRAEEAAKQRTLFHEQAKEQAQKSNPDVVYITKPNFLTDLNKHLDEWGERWDKENPAPPEDKTPLKTKPVEKVRYEPIPESERLQRPVLDVASAKAAYDESRKQALARLYGASDADAESSLEADHNSAKVEAYSKIINSPANRISIAKKENNMPQFIFNSRNNKEAHVDPSLLQHGFDTVVKGIQSGGDFVIQKGQQFVHDVLHPFSHHFDGNQEKLDQLRQTLKFDNAGYGETSDMAWRANDALGDYINNHQHLDPNWVGIGTDVGVPAAFTTYVKRKEITDAVKNKVDSLKGKLNQRKDNKSELDRRKNIWDSAPDHARDELVEDYGRQSNPYHPKHMDVHAPGSGSPWDRIAGVGVPRTSSVIAKLSASLIESSVSGSGRFTYYENPEIITRYKGPDINKECTRCGIQVSKPINKMCRDCYDVERS